MNGELAALVALLPMITGPLPAGDESITARLCGGGSITIPLERDGEPPRPDHCSKACHAGNCRKRSAESGVLEID